MKYFKFYPADFLIGSAYLTNEEVGIYIKMLCYQWDKGIIPTDRNLLNRMFNGIVTDAILDKFTKTESGLLNQRLADERVKAIDKIEKLKANGLKGAINKHYGKVIIDPNGKPDPSGYKFRIGLEYIFISPSEYMKEFNQAYVEQQLMQYNLKADANHILDKAYKKLDTDYSTYDFMNHNHLKNSFRSILSYICKPKITADKPVKLKLNGSDTF